MNYGRLTPESPPEDYSVVLHEFGHALGLIHEHQSPANGIQWDRPAVIRDLSGPPNRWDPPTIEHNVFNKYTSQTVSQFTQFDPESIMLYAFPSHWTVEMNLGRLRLILLSYTDTENLPPEVFGGLEEESIQKISKPELLAFFTKLYEERKRRQKTDFTPADIAKSVAKVLREVDPKSVRYLRLLNQAIIKEGKRLRMAGDPS
jgi:hypothetical protein